MYLVSQKNLGSKSVSDLGKQDKVKLELETIGSYFRILKNQNKKLFQNIKLKKKNEQE